MSARRGPTKERQHRGSRPEPLTVEEFRSWFDVLTGPEGRSLKRYPETLDSVHVKWRDANGLVHHPETFEDLIAAYRSELTGTVEVGTMGATRPRVQASYFPGGDRARVVLQVNGAVGEVDEIVDASAALFPDPTADDRNSVFMSYRREASWTLAVALDQYLTAAGIDVFYDVRDIRAGRFEHVILNQILARPYFMLVLTPGTLERCKQPRDWLRREIEFAVACDRVIVPVHTETFELEAGLREGLPGALGETVASFQAQRLAQDSFESAVQMLAEEFFVPTELAVTAAPAEDESDVARLRVAASGTPTIGMQQLSAQQHFEVGRKKGLAGDLTGATVCFDEAIQVDPSLANAHNGRGNVRQELGDLTGAIADYGEALRLDPNFGSAYANRGSARAQRGDLAGAMADLEEAVRRDPTNAMAYVNRGNVRLYGGDPHGAITEYDRAIGLNPDEAVAYANRGSARALQGGDLTAAMSDLDEAVRKDPRLAMAYFNRGHVRLEDAGDPDGAISDLDQAIGLNPDDAAAFFDHAKAKEQLGDLDGALADLDHAIGLDPGDAMAYAHRGTVRLLRGDLAGGITEYDEALRIDPKLAMALFNRGKAKDLRGDQSGAIKDLEEVTRLDPDDAEAEELLEAMRRRLVPRPKQA